MNILYGVQATGNGHINRSREIIKLLKEKHNVQVLLSGREADKFFDIEDFKPYHIYDGLTFKTKEGTIDYVETVKNLKITKFYKDVAEYNKEHDLVITDFEPITSRIAKKLKIPSIGLAHQYAFQYDLPGPNYVFSNTIMKVFAPADIEIGIHWWHFDGVIVPPILPKDLESTTCNNTILVYLPWMKKEKIIKKLNKLDKEFHVFHPIKEKEEYDNITIHPLSRKRFIEKLRTCDGVISNAGFQLSSEAIALNKKLFVIPLKGQPEQESNAAVLKELSLGMSDNKLRNDGLIEYWLKSTNRNNELKKDTAEKIVDWINYGKWSSKDLIERIWG